MDGEDELFHYHFFDSSNNCLKLFVIVFSLEQMLLVYSILKSITIFGIASVSIIYIITSVQNKLDENA
jgi:hypothetical protein